MLQVARVAPASVAAAAAYPLRRALAASRRTGPTATGVPAARVAPPSPSSCSLSHKMSRAIAASAVKPAVPEFIEGDFDYGERLSLHRRGPPGLRPPPSAPLRLPPAPPGAPLGGSRVP